MNNIVTKAIGLTKEWQSYTPDGKTSTSYNPPFFNKRAPEMLPLMLMPTLWNKNCRWKPSVYYYRYLIHAEKNSFTQWGKRNVADLSFYPEHFLIDETRSQIRAFWIIKRGHSKYTRYLPDLNLLTFWGMPRSPLTTALISFEYHTWERYWAN